MTWEQDNQQWRANAAKRWASRDAEPLRLRGWLAAPVAWDGWDPLTIEGALQYAVIVRETGRMPDDVYRGCPIDLPLLMTDVQIPIVDSSDYGEVPIALSSCGVFADGSQVSVRWRRTRPRADYYACDAVKISTADMKAHNIPAQTVTASYLDFFVVGDAEKIRDLLKDVSYIGSRRAGGLGALHGWEVEAHKDWSLFDAGGRLMRSLPDSGIEYPGSEIRLITLRAPYWHPRTRCLGRVPIATLQA